MLSNESDFYKNAYGVLSCNPMTVECLIEFTWKYTFEKIVHSFLPIISLGSQIDTVSIINDFANNNQDLAIGLVTNCIKINLFNNVYKYRYFNSDLLDSNYELDYIIFYNVYLDDNSFLQLLTEIISTKSKFKKARILVLND